MPATALAESSAGTVLIEVEDLVKRYRKADTNAVDGVSFSVRQGELFTLLGPNGAGKTTTVSVLTTTLLPTSGRVTIAGHDVARSAAAVRAVSGVIFQSPSLDDNLTAEENLRFHAVLYGLYPWRPLFRMMPAEYRRRVGELTELLGISKELGRPVKKFSGGMRRKLEIVRTLLHRPRVLFLDEPTTGLDPASRRDLWNYLREVQAEHGTTILLTTHYLQEAEDADQVCIIDHGRIVAAGSPLDVKRQIAREHLLLDAAPADRPALRSELVRMGVEVGDAFPLRVEVGGAAGSQAMIAAIRTPLTHLEVRAPSVEDAYLSIIGREED